LLSKYSYLNYVLKDTYKASYYHRRLNI